MIGSLIVGRIRTIHFFEEDAYETMRTIPVFKIAALLWRYLRVPGFHNDAVCCLVSTVSLTPVLTLLFTIPVIDVLIFPFAHFRRFVENRYRE